MVLIINHLSVAFAKQFHNGKILKLVYLAGLEKKLITTKAENKKKMVLPPCNYLFCHKLTKCFNILSKGEKKDFFVTKKF